MINEQRIRDLATRALTLEEKENGSAIGCTALAGWCFVFRCMTEDEFNRLDALPEAELSSFLMGDHSNDELWEKFQDLFNFHEEWSYGELLVRLEKMSDKDMADAMIWEWILARMPITRLDYEFFNSLTDEHMEAICMGASPQAIGDESIYPQIKAAHPDYDLDNLDDRLNRTYFLWETHVTSHGDNWANHP